MSAASGATFAHRNTVLRTKFPDVRSKPVHRRPKGWNVNYFENALFSAPKPKRWALKPSVTGGSQDQGPDMGGASASSTLTVTDPCYIEAAARPPFTSKKLKLHRVCDRSVVQRALDQFDAPPGLPSASADEKRTIAVVPLLRSRGRGRFPKDTVDADGAWLRLVQATLCSIARLVCTFQRNAPEENKKFGILFIDFGWCKHNLFLFE